MFAFQLLSSSRPALLDQHQVEELVRRLEVENRLQAEEANRKAVTNDELARTYSL